MMEHPAPANGPRPQRSICACFCISQHDEEELRRSRFVGKKFPDTTFPDNSLEFDVEWVKHLRRRVDLQVMPWSVRLDRDRHDWEKRLADIFSQPNLVLIIFESVEPCPENIARGYEDLVNRALDRDVPMIAVWWKNDVLQKDLIHKRIKRIPEKGQLPLLQRKNRDTSVALAIEDLASAVSAISDSLEHGPRVGVGALLLNRRGKFLLTQRKYAPGRGKISTVGGKLLFNEAVDTGLLRCMDEQFSGIDKSKITVGPLLACTNMVTDPEDHYVDLTFYAYVDDDPENWRFRGYRYGYCGSDYNLWFSFKETYELFHKDRRKFFEPVANAFEQFLIFQSLSDLSFGIATRSPDGRFIWKPPTEMSDPGVLPRTSNLSGYLLCCLKVTAKHPLFFDVTAEK